ncbi:hypothetical protein GOP47_0023760 [Adiantum capillus-veneris]|uniref:Uncharacterized protein n=1 Tax=Adiantum capillus-veneris TaxID=13818 RepID=A0A9D4Z4V7_ADICA|nr:hypothetical protein GOP47_0023760 [Adiantum capillus-veneris]
MASSKLFVFVQLSQGYGSSGLYGKVRGVYGELGPGRFNVKSIVYVSGFYGRSRFIASSRLNVSVYVQLGFMAVQVYRQFGPYGFRFYGKVEV